MAGLGLALYPDPLVAQILAASTLPAQIVLADRQVMGSGDPGQIAQQPWDASVQAMARYSTVLKYMDDNLAWTTALGQAFLNQQPEVMNSIQRLRAAASKLGNLQSCPQQRWLQHWMPRGLWQAGSVVRARRTAPDFPSPDGLGTRSPPFRRAEMHPFR